MSIRYCRASASSTLKERRTGWQRLRNQHSRLLIAIIWRFTASLPTANSHNRPDDTAFDQAAVLIAQPLPPGAALFAAVDDALALQYLIDIWQLRPDLHVVSSAEAARWLGEGQAVFATWQAATTLRGELPTTLAPSQQGAGPDWIIFQTSKPNLVQRRFC